ncbi:uncharacterized protein LOC129582491 [Paramacrobiotus metropolitanus]|uniref:uncharacterized protein LOC129582491 n=1 Tax=Paramacrobiotus metropolitanus TaxID=2943436 RepID=UPI002445CC81|nr:uncharacterized protein LOC129582491 [Paramacrobiotus metropolitanus]XP_055329978.1 uncharacterized protein LOC129582491 [Paramacrobiotus metropolitanus]
MTESMDCPLLPLFKEAIRRLKDQRERPGVDRIVQTLKTHHQVRDAEAVRRQLELAVRSGHLIAVYINGLQCYKDPDCLRDLRRFKVDNLQRVQQAVKFAVRAIGDPQGSSLEEIENYVRVSFIVSTPTLREQMNEALGELLRKGTLDQPAPERYRFCSAGKLPDNAAAKQLATSSDTTETIPLPPVFAVPSIPAPRPRGLPKRVIPLPDPAPPSPSTDSPAPVKRKRGFTPTINPPAPALVEVPPASLLAPPVSPPPPAEVLPALPVLPAAAPPIPEEKVSPVGIRRSPRYFKEYQCAPCRFYVTDHSALLLHVAGPQHRRSVASKMVQCSTCHFRTRSVDKMTEHLQRHGCHAGKSVPSCLLRSSASGDLLAK